MVIHTGHGTTKESETSDRAGQSRARKKAKRRTEEKEKRKKAFYLTSREVRGGNLQSRDSFEEALGSGVRAQVGGRRKPDDELPHVVLHP